MNNLQLWLYHRLPSALRLIPVTMRGLYLRNWRYNSETERLVEEAVQRESWGPDRWKTWREEKLALVLHRAATSVPYYRELWNARRRKGDMRSWESLGNWPILEKEVLRKNPLAFLAEGCDPRRMYREYTSGTSGTPVNIWWSRSTVRGFYALFEARWRHWYRVSRHDRWAILGGQLVAPVSQIKPPFWVWNAAMHQLYMSCYHLMPQHLSRYLDALREYKVKYVWGYTSALCLLAEFALRENRKDIQMAVVITNAEPLSEGQRELISRAFQCPVRETYGMAEIVAAASECESGRLHLWPELGIPEILDHDMAAPNGNAGDLVSTGIFNTDMPLIRYRVGDRAALAADDAPCSCRRALPILKSVEGRLDDIIRTSDGRSVGRMDTVFKGGLPIIEAQIIQEELDSIRVKVVPANGFGARDTKEIARQVRDRVGDGVQVIVEPVDAIPRSANGKFRAVISKVTSQSAAPLMMGNLLLLQQCIA